MVRNIRISILVFFLLFASSHVFSQDVQVEAKADSNHITIGDWLRISITATHKSDVSVTFPLPPDTLEGFVFLKHEFGAVKPAGDQIQEMAIYTVTSFDSGMHIFPALPVSYSVKGDTAKKYAQTSPIPVVVRGVAVDTSQDIKDVKPPLSVPITFADILPYLIAVVALAVIIVAVIYIRRKLKRGESILPSAPPRPPDEVALEALRSVESEHLWQQGKVKEYHSAVTDIVRTYIERRFGVMAMEMTSDEILSSSLMEKMPDELAAKLREMLVCADLVKFAKFQPRPEENEKTLGYAVGFVQETRAHAVAKAETAAVEGEVKQ